MPSPAARARCAVASLLAAAGLAALPLAAGLAYAEDPFQSAPGPAAAPTVPRPRPPAPPREVHSPPTPAEPAPAVATIPRPPPGPPDGTWSIYGSGDGGRCGDWMVRLSVARGAASGFLSIGKGTLPLRVVLQPDGSFSGNADSAVGVYTTAQYTLSGNIAGDRMTLKLDGAGCPRTGQARRAP